MFVHYRTQGIILKKIDRGESNKLFTFYTKDFGKLDITGKAIRKISSKLKSGAEIFYLSEIEFIQGKRQKILTDTVSIERFENIRKDLVKLKLSHRIVEIFIDLISGSEKDKRLWELLLFTFRKINNSQFTNSGLRLQYYYFIWSLFSILGYLPELYHCASCGKRLTPEILYFNPGEGGIICAKCFPKIEEAKKISANAVKLLRIITEKGEKIINKIKINKADLKELQLMTDYFLKNHLIEKRN